MSDVIIAIVPAPGHEGLTADGPMGERPALLLRDIGEWLTVDRAAHAPHLYNDCDVALVLHAPGGPKLGMVRLMGCLPNRGAWCYPEPPMALDADAMDVFAHGHLAVICGLASEVLVLPVPA